MKGYIRLFKSISENELWSDKPFARGQAWIDLLMLAAYKDYRTILRGSVIEIKRGEIYTTGAFLENRWGWSRNKVRTFLSTLEGEAMVTIKGTPKGTIITIENYDKFQLQQPTEGIAEGIAEGTTEGITEGTTEGTLKNKNINNIYINNNNKIQQQQKSSGGHRFLSDYLSEDEFGKITSNFDEAVKLIDTVDELVSEPEKVKNPFRYIIGFAKNKNWPRKELYGRGNL